MHCEYVIKEKVKSFLCFNSFYSFCQNNQWHNELAGLKTAARYWLAEQNPIQYAWNTDIETDIIKRRM